MKKYILISVMLFLFSNGFSQTTDSVKKYRWGFNLGLNYSNTQIKNIDPLTQISNSAGFKMGVIMERRLTNYLSFSPKAELSFNNSKVTFINIPENKEVYHVYPVLMEFVSHFTYKLNGKETTPYVLFGPAFQVPVTNDNTIHYATKRSAIAFDLGFGINKKLSTFNLAPELRYSFGLLNLRENSMLGKLFFNAMTLVLNFKG